MGAPSGHDPPAGSPDLAGGSKPSMRQAAEIGRLHPPPSEPVSHADRPAARGRASKTNGTPKTKPDLVKPHPQANVVEVKPVEFSLRFWMLVVLVGVGAGLAGGLLMRLLYAAEHLAWSYGSGNFVDAVGRTSPAHRLLVTGLAGLLVSAGLLLLRFAKGGHAGELTVAIWFHDGRMPAARTLGRSVLSIIIVAMGAAVGREGALKQTGALLAHRAAAFFDMSAPERRLLTAIGAGAGLAAAYNIPFGGALFALEVLLGAVSLPLAVPAIACSIIATAVSWVLLPMRAAYDTPAYSLSWNQLAWALLIGPIAGLLTVGYIRLIAWSGRDHPHGKFATAVFPPLVFLVLGGAAILYPQLLGNGRDVVQFAIDGKLGPLSLVLALLVLRPLATAFCLKCGAPGGLFTPTLTVGALLGAALGRVWIAICPGALQDARGYAVIGAGAVLAAATSGPVSTIVILLELGRHVDLLVVPLGLAIVGALIVIRAFDAPSIYSVGLRRSERIASKRAQETPTSVEVSRDYRAVSADTRAVQARRLLVGTGGPDGPVFVIDQKDRLVGRLDLDKLDRRIEHNPVELVTVSDVAERAGSLPADASAEAAKRKLAELGVCELPVTDREGRILGVFKADGSKS